MKNTSQAYFNSVLNFLKQREIEPAVALNAIGFPEFSHYSAQQRVSLEHYSAMLDYGVIQLNDPLFGFHLGRDIHNVDYGVLGYLIESSENLAGAINNLLKFDRLVANIGQSKFDISEHHASISWLPYEQCTDQIILRNMTAWLTTARRLLSDELNPIKVSLQGHYTKQQLTYLSQWFACPVQCNKVINQIDFPLEFLTRKFRTDNSSLHQAMVALSQQQLTKLNDNQADDNIKHQVCALLNNQHDLQQCTLVNFASLLIISRRTLQRKLKNEHSQFGQLLDLERQQRAQTLIGTLNLSDLALQLGFNEQSSLNRAFKRWHGCSPKVYLQRDNDVTIKQTTE